MYLFDLRNKKTKTVLTAVLMLALLLPMVMAFNVSGVEASSEEILKQQFEMQEEFRFWEIRTELHRIHHHLEHVPYMVFASVGIFIVLLGLLIVKIMELKK